MTNKPEIEAPKSTALAVVRDNGDGRPGLILQSKEVIKAGQDVIKKSLTTLDKQIHENAVQCLMHCEKHGDTSLMRRLLMEVVDEKTGYRRAGLINWIRKHSPIELTKTDLNLSGVDAKGNKRPFLIMEANDTPFYMDKANAEKVAAPVFQATLLTGINKAIKDFRAAIANTVDGKPIDEKKPFYDGIFVQEMTEFFDDLEARQAKLKHDNRAEIAKAQAKLAQEQRIAQAA